ncbi:MAG: chemotaxis protein CheW [Polyangiaceae bacterium]
MSLLELVRLEAEQAKTSIEYVYGTPVYRLRGNLLPLVFLSRALGEDSVESKSADGSVNIVVLQADGRQFGLVVDGVNDTEEIVVKPLGKELKGLNVFAGATIMGDGRVALILDVLGLAQRANLAGARARVERAREERAPEEDKETLLLFRAGEAPKQGDDGRCMAVPLSMVARLEEFPRERIERAGRRPVVQYRGEIMPLIDLGELLAQKKAGNGDEPLQVIVTAHGSRSVGLVVDRIVDIVEERLAVKDKGRQKGVLGAAVVQGKVTELLDIEGIIRAAEPQFFEHA